MNFVGSFQSCLRLKHLLVLAVPRRLWQRRLEVRSVLSSRLTPRSRLELCCFVVFLVLLLARLFSCIDIAVTVGVQRGLSLDVRENELLSEPEVGLPHVSSKLHLNAFDGFSVIRVRHRFLAGLGVMQRKHHADVGLHVQRDSYHGGLEEKLGEESRPLVATGLNQIVIAQSTDCALLQLIVEQLNQVGLGHL